MRSFTFAFLLFTVFIYMIDFSFQENRLNFRAARDTKIKATQRLTPTIWYRLDLVMSSSGDTETGLDDPEEDEPDFGFTAQDTGEDEANLDEIKEIMRMIDPKIYLIREMKSNIHCPVAELKKLMSEFSAALTSDSEILLDIVMEFKEYEFQEMTLVNGQTSVVPKDDLVIRALSDLQFLVLQTDNAMEFVKLNGFVDVIYKCLSSTNNVIKSEALRLHGSATQIDPEVQVAAFDAGSMPILLKILSSDADEQVKARSLYALTCLVRQYPAAQMDMITDDGLTVLASFFDDPKADSLVLQLRVATLFQDLLLERQNVSLTLIEEENRYPGTANLTELKKRLQEYDAIDLNERLVEENWCSRISDWVLKQDLTVDFEIYTKFSIKVPVVSQFHNKMKQTIDTVYVVCDICKSEYIYDSDLVELIDELKYMYAGLVEKEPDNDKSYGKIYSNLLRVLQIIQRKFDEETLRQEKLLMMY